MIVRIKDLTLELSVEEYIKLQEYENSLLLLEDEPDSPYDITEEDLQILADYKMQLSKTQKNPECKQGFFDRQEFLPIKEEKTKESPEQPTSEQTTSKIEVLVDGEGWKLFNDVAEAAKAIDARKEHLLFALENKKTCNGMQVRYYSPERKKNNTKSVKVEKRSKEFPDSVIKVYESIRKCAAEEEIGYVNLSQQLKKNKKYEYGPFIFQLVEPIDETLKQIEEDKKKPYEISK